MKRHVMIGLTMVAVMLAALSCSKQNQVKGIELKVTFSETPLSDNLFVDMIYEWKTGSDFLPMDKDYNVFVHFWHKDNMLFQDDHLPVVPTSQWGPGQVTSYTRRIYIPTFIDEFDPQFSGVENMKMSIGFYSPLDRSGKSKAEVHKATIKVFPPPPGTPEIIYESGWYDLEINPEAILKQWRWTAREARCVIDNPRRDAMFVVRGGQNLDLLKEQKIIIKINDQVLEEFSPKDGIFEKSYTVPQSMMGDKDEFYLVIATDKTFIPALSLPNSKDERELGLQISFLYFR
ncbi:MAG: hypothetical protein A2Y86_03870 [Candidatus Aminicenantes bacterium RBG_13_62_12]|nr:MAG: hypothetical protein A2Y86_03870 [Candidatus Aminicenantes bacterium RBG_13_62_12]